MQIICCCFRPRFFIISEMNSKVMDIKGDNAASGASVIMFQKKGGNCPNQLWYFDDQGVIRSALNDYALEARCETLHLVYLLTFAQV